ncbi:MAG: heme-copper oxidase subunit III [Myxococcaceae bacterium]
MSAHGHAHAPAVWPADRDFGLVRPAKLAMWIYLLSDWFSFAGLLLAYGILRSNAVVWRHAGEPAFPIPVTAVLTLVLAVSTMAMIRAFDDSVSGNRKGTQKWLLLTGLCGLVFLLGQGREWSGLIEHGLVFGQTAYANTFFVITGFHLLHVVAGLVYLGFTLVRNARGVTTPNEIQLFELFWLFIYFGWNVVFVIVYLIPSGVS